MRLYLTLALLLFSCISRAEVPANDIRQLYCVNFEVTVDARGKVAVMKVINVTGIGARSVKPLEVQVPDVYLDAARAFFAVRTYPANPGHFFTYLAYDPARPEGIYLDPEICVR
jgi:hypothetical protein